MLNDSQLVKGNTVEAHPVAFWADRLDVAAKTLYRAIASGKLQAYHIGRAVRVTEEQIFAYLEGGARA